MSKHPYSWYYETFRVPTSFIGNGFPPSDTNIKLKYIKPQITGWTVSHRENRQDETVQRLGHTRPQLSFHVGQGRSQVRPCNCLPNVPHILIAVPIRSGMI